MLSTTSHYDTLAPDDKCLSSTESSDCGDSHSIGGQSSPKHNSILSPNRLSLSPQSTDADFDCGLSCSSAEATKCSPITTQFPSQLSKPPVTHSHFADRVQQCPSLFNKMKCELGSECCYSHREEDFRDILMRMRHGQKYFMLEEYPDVALMRAATRNCSLLFD